jgi:hypothetical protein
MLIESLDLGHRFGLHTHMEEIRATRRPTVASSSNISARIFKPALFGDGRSAQRTSWLIAAEQFSVVLRTLRHCDVTG